MSSHQGSRSIMKAQKLFYEHNPVITKGNARGNASLRFVENG